jgi:hypothetical protein
MQIVEDILTELETMQFILSMITNQEPLRKRFLRLNFLPVKSLTYVNRQYNINHDVVRIGQIHNTINSISIFYQIED